jgi:hypothetical protein
MIKTPSIFHYCTQFSCRSRYSTYRCKITAPIGTNYIITCFSTSAPWPIKNSKYCTKEKVPWN